MYENPSSYPDWLLTVPRPVAINFVILNTPVHVLLESQFKDYVHLSTGVKVPREIQYHLSVGMRYMFHSKRNSSLIMDAFKDFNRRIRWRLFFSFQVRTEEQRMQDEDYDPDYEVPRSKSGKLIKLPGYLEQGLALGKVYVAKNVAKIPDEKDSEFRKSFTPSRSLVEKFLIDNNYIVTNTDKNLGIAVSERSWIESKCLDLLNDRANYEELTPDHKARLLRQQCIDADDVGIDALNLEKKQLSDFLRSSITPHEVNRSYEDDVDDEWTFLEPHNVPIFYGIPKIHKKPVKMRPIIPCHSAIQNPAAKYVSKTLKPLIMAAPTILHGTKDLAIKLSKLELSKTRRWYIVTGDVVAYYPNIPIDKCIDRVFRLFVDHFYGRGNEPYVQPDNLDDFSFERQCDEIELFLKCLNLGNKNLVTQFKDKFYLQKQGLAMGVASSPDLANLYGVWDEMKVRILEDPSVAFYGRYIDDVFAIVYADSEQEALGVMSKVVIEDCVIEWNAGDNSPFLDMFLWRNVQGQLEHRPYRKAGNHQERVPWISHHPFDVKRGTYLGEMSRLAVLCSSEIHYVEAIKSLAALYVARGYPSNLIENWTKLHMAKRWSARLNTSSAEVERNKGAESDVLVLKSEFNTAWNYFNATELGNTILGYWREWLDHFDTGNFTEKFPDFGVKTDRNGLTLVDPSKTVQRTTFTAVRSVPDVRKLDILNRRMIVSRKRTRNLFDLTSLWKKTVLHRLEEDAQVDGTSQLTSDIEESTLPGLSSDPVQVLHSQFRDVTLEGDLEYTAGPSTLFLK